MVPRGFKSHLPYMSEFVCKYCDKVCKNLNSLAQHEIRCKNNPNKIAVISNFIKYNELVKTGKIEKPFSNQYVKADKLGLPRPVDTEETRIRKSNANRGRIRSQEFKDKISRKQKENYKGKSRWYTQTQHRLSYAEQYFMEIFKSAKMHYHVNRYFLDFAYPEHKLYIEIDGEQHKLDPKVVEHDRVRTEILNDEGWFLYKRIYWPDFVKLKNEERVKFIEDIKKDLKNFGILI